MNEKKAILLPADRFMACKLWPDDDPIVAAAKYQKFKNEIESRVTIDPSQPQAGAALGLISLVSGVISIGLTIVASFFKPKAPEPGTGGLTSSEQQGANIVSTRKIAPSVGFSSIQEPSPLGSVIPVIWARRQNLGPQSKPPRPAGMYGGVRVNFGLIFSQIWTKGGAQIVRAMYLIGEGKIDPPDPNGYAIGDSSLASYLIENQAARERVSRATIYISPEGGRIESGHRVFGRLAAEDVANSENYGGPSVFSVRGNDGEYREDFCYSAKPSNATVFGIYAHIPNGIGIRPNPRIAPTIRVTTVSESNGERFRVDCDDDPQRLADFWKYRYQYSLRGGIISSSGGEHVQPNDTFRYFLQDSTDAATTFIFDSTNTDNSSEEASGEVKCSDIASTIASRQKEADDALIIGEVYKVGSCLAVLVERIPDDGVFISDADNEPLGNGQEMEYVFRVIREGSIAVISNSQISPDWTGDTIKPPQWNRSTSLNNIDIPDEFPVCSSRPQIFRCAIATIRLARSARIFEIGIRSTVGIRVNGLCNFRDCQSLVRINQNAGTKYQGQSFDKNEKIGVANFQSGTIQRSETRISFFLIQYRHGSDAWQTLEGVWGIRGTSDQPVNNAIRFEMLVDRPWEIRLEPLTSYEIRNDDDLPEPFFVIDSKSSNRHKTVVNGGIVIEWYGEEKAKNGKNFNIPALDPKEDIGIRNADENSLIDDWAMVAETFIYPEIQSSIDNGPEHEIVYVNTFSVNAIPPTFDRIAIGGLNIHGSTEFQQLSQFSGYISGGIHTRRTLEQDTIGSTNLFPDALRAYLTDKRYGRGDSAGDHLVDLPSFVDSAGWCQIRRYFYDAVDSEKVNLLQWAADIASYHLLELNQRGGKWALVQALYFPEDGPVPVRALFTAGNIVENTFKLQYLSRGDRQTIQMSVKWREERQRADYSGSGFFPVEREVFVREASQSGNDPIEPLNLVKFCTNVEQAIDVACYFIRMRRLITHTIAFSTTPDGLTNGLAAGHYIKVAMDLAYFDQFSNGVILEDGTVLSTRNDLLPTGSHQVVAWDGASDFIYDTTVTVDSNGKASPAGIVFAKKTTVSQVYTYKVEKISISEDGLIDIEAVHHPCDANGISEIGKNWTTYQTDSNWVVEGNETEPDYCTCPLVSGVPLPGNVLSVGDVICNSGIATKTSVQWYRDYVAIDGATNSSYTFTSQDSGRVIFAEITYQTQLGYVQTCRTFAAESDLYAASVVLLLHMNGDHNSVAFPDSSPYSHATFNGTFNGTQGGSFTDSRIVRYNSRFGGSSAVFYLDSFGSFNHPSYTHPTAFQVTASDDFTAEGWFNFADLAFGRLFQVFGFEVQVSGSGISARADFPNNAWVISTSPIVKYTWLHVAVVRNSGTVTIYVNGQSRATGLAAFASGATTARIGRAQATLYDEIRFTKGIARYTSSFSPPTTAFLPDSSVIRPNESVVFLMHCNGTEGSISLTNDTAYDFFAMTGKVGHTYITAAQSKFGGSSLFFSGNFANGQTLGTYWIPDAAETDYTVDLWIRPASKSSGQLFDKFGTCRWDAGVLKYEFTADGAGRTLLFENVAAGKVIPLNAWSHIAVTRSGLTVRCFLNGEVIGVYNGTTRFVMLSVVSYFNIGGSAFNQNLYSGYIDEFRVVLNGAMWTGNFTPPTQPYVNPTN
jgi:hypothetical protein